MRLLFSHEDPVVVFLETEDEASDWAETFADVPDDIATRWRATEKAWLDMQEEIAKSSFPTVTREAPARIREREEKEAARVKAEQEAAHAETVVAFWKEQ